jgi:hypothetical protein
MNSADNFIKQSRKYFISRILFENYDEDQLLKSQHNTTDDENKQRLIRFVNYHGPTISYDKTKRLFSPNWNLYNNQSNPNHSLSNSQEKFQTCFTELMLDEFVQTIPSIVNSNKCISMSDLENLEEDEYFILFKLGFKYFSGKSFIWNMNYSLKEIESILSGVKINRIPKNAHLSTAFNGNKGLLNEDQFLNYLSARSYQYIKTTRSYFLDFGDNIKLELNSNFQITKSIKEQKKIFNIDFLRDRQNSTYKSTHAFTDIFDIRTQLNKQKAYFDQDQVYELLSSNRNFRENIIKRSDDGYNLILNDQIDKLQLTYMRESRDILFRAPMGLKNDLNPFKYWRYFDIFVSTNTEYTREQSSSFKEENTGPTSSNRFGFTKSLIADSIVSSRFNLIKWLFDLKKFSQQHKLTKTFEEMFNEIGCFCFNELFDFSNKMKEINSQANKNQREKSKLWFSGLIDYQLKNPKIEPKLKYLFHNEIIDYEKITLVKKIIYSKSYLEIFDLNLKSIDNITEENLKKAFDSIVAKLDMNVDSIEKLSLESFKGKGIIKIAINRLCIAYATLRDPVKRDEYLKKPEYNDKNRKTVKIKD